MRRYVFGANTTLDPDQWERLERATEETGMRKTEILRQALEQWHQRRETCPAPWEGVACDQ